MTDENIDRKLFKLIYPDGCWHESDGSLHREWCGKCGEWALHARITNPSYSTSISDAMEAVDKAIQQNLEWKIAIEVDRQCASVVIQKWYLLEDRYRPLIAQVDHESLPTAITKALIEALEAKP